MVAEKIDAGSLRGDSDRCLPLVARPVHLQRLIVGDHFA